MVSAKCRRSRLVVHDACLLILAYARLYSDVMVRKPIEDETLQEAVARLVDGLHPRAIILFGSQARGTSRPDSDYDLLVISDELRDYDEVYRPLVGRGFRCDVVPCTLESGENWSGMQAAFCGRHATTAFCCMALRASGSRPPHDNGLRQGACSLARPRTHLLRPQRTLHPFLQSHRGGKLPCNRKRDELDQCLTHLRLLRKTGSVLGNRHFQECHECLRGCLAEPSRRIRMPAQDLRNPAQAVAPKRGAHGELRNPQRPARSSSSPER